jgi:hypothetical protein
LGLKLGCLKHPILCNPDWFFDFGFFANSGIFLALGMQLFANLTALVEHFKFFSERIGEKCPLFFTLFFSLKKQVKNFENSSTFWLVSKFSP